MFSKKNTQSEQTFSKAQLTLLWLMNSVIKKILDKILVSRLGSRSPPKFNYLFLVPLSTFPKNAIKIDPHIFK